MEPEETATQRYAYAPSSPEMKHMIATRNTIASRRRCAPSDARLATHTMTTFAWMAADQMYSYTSHEGLTGTKVESILEVRPITNRKLNNAAPMYKRRRLRSA